MTQQELFQAATTIGAMESISQHMNRVIPMSEAAREPMKKAKELVELAVELEKANLADLASRETYCD